MYFAQSINEHRIEIFRILLMRTIEGYDGYRNDIIKVISEVKDLISGSKDLYTIDKDQYPLIIYLKENGEKYLDTIDITNMGKEEFNQILSILETNNQLCLA